MTNTTETDLWAGARWADEASRLLKPFSNLVDRAHKQAPDETRASFITCAIRHNVAAIVEVLELVDVVLAAPPEPTPELIDVGSEPVQRPEGITQEVWASLSLRARAALAAMNE